MKLNTRLHKQSIVKSTKNLAILSKTLEGGELLKKRAQKTLKVQKQGEILKEIKKPLKAPKSMNKIYRGKTEKAPKLPKRLRDRQPLERIKHRKSVKIIPPLSVP